MAKEGSAEATIRDIKLKTRRKYNVEEKIRIVIEGLRGGEMSAAASKIQSRLFNLIRKITSLTWMLLWRLLQRLPTVTFCTRQNDNVLT